MAVRGEVIGEFINGTPCKTDLLHHEESVTTFLTGEVATWTGMVEGEEVEEERKKLAGCYKAPLNAQVTGGLLEWKAERSTPEVQHSP